MTSPHSLDVRLRHCRGDDKERAGVSVRPRPWWSRMSSAELADCLADFGRRFELPLRQPSQRLANGFARALTFGLAYQLALAGGIPDAVQERLDCDRVRRCPRRAAGPARLALSTADRARQLRLGHLRASFDVQALRLLVKLLCGHRNTSVSARAGLSPFRLPHRPDE